MRKLPSTEYLLRRLWAVLAIFALVALGALLYAEDARQALASASLVSVLSFMTLIMLSWLVRTAKWRYLSACLGVRLPWRGAWAVYVGGFPMTLTPARAGELWRCWVMCKRWGMNYRRALPLIFCDRLLDLNTLLFFAMAGIFVGWWLTAALAALALAPLLLLFLRPRWFAQMVKIIWVLCRRAKPRFFAALLAMCRHLQTVTRPGLYLPALLLALLSWLLEALAIVLIVSGVGGVLSVLWAIVALGTANIAGVLTLLPGGIGGQEVTLIYLLEDAGNTAGVALAATVVVRLFALGGATLLGLPFFIFLSRTTVNGNASRHRAR